MTGSKKEKEQYFAVRAETRVDDDVGNQWQAGPRVTRRDR
jgi:hypothetical protein